MVVPHSVLHRREACIADLFPQGMPRLWCPILTHFRGPRQLDAERITRHLQHLAPYVQGILVPGSTGEGWEMTDDDVLELLAVVLDAVQGRGIKVLIGVLKTDIAAVLNCLDTTARWLLRHSGCSAMEEVFASTGVVGFTVCPPCGSELGQEAIAAALTQVLERGLPTALYQLPQVTQNEMSPDTVRQLAAQFPNFYLLKDTSGRDRIAESAVDLNGVFLVRGAEGDYARWPKAAGGPYDGFLLSTANTLAAPLSEILRLLDVRNPEEARELSRRVSCLVEQCFAAASSCPAGNPFTNANKALDHVLTYGAAALEHEPPWLYSGVRLPHSLIAAVAAIVHDQADWLVRFQHEEKP